MRYLNCAFGFDSRLRAVWLTAAALVTLTGCMSGGDDETTAMAQPANAELAAATTPDGFPNINVVPRGETSQMTAGEKAALVSELRTAIARQKSEGVTPTSAAEIARLRRLAQRHGIDTLAAIEGN